MNSLLSKISMSLKSEIELKSQLFIEIDDWIYIPETNKAYITKEIDIHGKYTTEVGLTPIMIEKINSHLKHRCKQQLLNLAENKMDWNDNLIVEYEV